MNPKLKQLVSAMLDHTRAGKLKWKSLGEDSFRSSIAEGLVRITGSRIVGEHQDGEPYADSFVRFVISDNLANIVVNEEIDDSDDFYKPCAALLREARASAFNGDRVLDSMLQSMGVVAA